MQKTSHCNSLGHQYRDRGEPSGIDAVRGPSFPEWLRRPIPSRGDKGIVEEVLKKNRLATVCMEAKCPNRGECYCKGTATFMIMGEICSRNCGFCSVSSGSLSPLDPEEPGRVAAAAAELGLRHIVVTSVTRDDLPDGGAGHFHTTVRAIKTAVPGATIEVLTPDFRGNLDALRHVLESGPDVFNHNVETVPRLYRKIRPQANYEQSLNVLRSARSISPKLPTKSGLMVGLGETQEEVIQVFTDLHNNGCRILTVGQYLRPSQAQAPVVEFVRPEQFDRYREIALSIGFTHVASAPYVRSSYRAEEAIGRGHAQ